VQRVTPQPLPQLLLVSIGGGWGCGSLFFFDHHQIHHSKTFDGRFPVQLNFGLLSALHLVVRGVSTKPSSGLITSACVMTVSTTTPRWPSSLKPAARPLAPRLSLAPVRQLEGNREQRFDEGMLN